jgi:N6-L-threonylcarbamoyladenine synthase
MRILAIETSCDETAIAVLKAEGGFENPEFNVVANNLLSQIEIHKEYGGVFPALAKRAHAKNLVPILNKTLKEARLFSSSCSTSDVEHDAEHVEENKNSNKISRGALDISRILEREPELLEIFLKEIPKIEKPDIDYIAVTYGPGLEPALWVGLNFAKALSVFWGIPLIPVNHMEGHIFSVLWNEKEIPNSKFPAYVKASADRQIPKKITFPAIALLISGGHTELLLMKDWFEYELLGETQDDAVGEAFDKVARMMDLPYPGGPEISKKARGKRIDGFEKKFNLPKPMMHPPTCNFSFSGLKTAVLYRVKDLDLDEKTKEQMAREFEDTVVEVLLEKTKKALKDSEAQTLIIGGGVIANTEIRNAFENYAKEFGLNLLIPDMKLTTDNAIMIGIAGYFRALKKPDGVEIDTIKANGNLTLS